MATDFDFDLEVPDVFDEDWDDVNAGEDFSEDLPERDEDNACPECDYGVTIMGRYDPETGFSDYSCSHCSWTG